MKNKILSILFVLGVASTAFSQVEYTTTGGGGAYSLTYPANLDAITPGLSFTFKANHANTAAATLTVNGFIYPIKKGVNTDLDPNDIQLDQIVSVVFDGTNFQMTSPVGNLGGGGGGDFFADGSVSMTGTFKAIGGSSAFPSITFDTDQNTGIYSGIADNLSFTTAGTQRLLIDNVGQVAIGGTSPVALLDVDGDVRIDYNSASQTTTSIFNSNSGFTSSLGGTKGLMVGVTTAGSEQLVGGEFRTDGASAGSQIALYASADGLSTGAFNRGFVAAAQNNSNANYGIDVYADGSSGTNYGMRINTGGTHAADKYGIYINSSGSGTRYGIYATGEDINYFNGDVGIGNITPNAKLDLNGDLLMGGMAVAPGLSAAGEGKIYFDGPSGAFMVSENGGAWTNLVSAGGGTPAGADGEIQFNTGGSFNSSTNLNWDNTNNYFGVGIAAPSATLDVLGTFKYSDGLEAAGYVLTSDATGNASWQPSDGNGIYDGGGTVPSSTGVVLTDDLSFDGTTLFIDGTNSRVGIGTNTPSVPFQVAGNMGQQSDADRFVRGGSGGDMIPVAYGVINDGVLQTNASEGDISAQKMAVGWYRLTYNGARTFTGLGEFALNLSVADQSSGSTAMMANYNYGGQTAGSEHVDIFIWDLMGGGSPNPSDGVVTFELLVK